TAAGAASASDRPAFIQHFSRATLEPCGRARRPTMRSFRFRRSSKLGPGVRLNVGKTGLGVSVGARGARRTFHSSGRQTSSVGIPGTGLGYVHTTRASKRSASEPVAAPAVTAKPGLFTPKHEKEFYKALQAYAKGDTEEARTLFESASAKGEGGRVLSDDLLAGIVNATTGKLDEAIP